MDYLYHSSKTKGLKELKPIPSTHKVPWVYATKDIATTAMFLGDNFDFICQTGAEQDGIPYIYEQFPGAFDQAYKGKTGSIYILDPESFQAGKTSWSPELVSEQSVPILGEEDVPDVQALLLQLQSEGKLHIYLYPDRPAKAPSGKSDIIEKGVKWTIDFGEDTLNKVEKYHPDVLPTVIRELQTKGYEFKSPYWQKYVESIQDQISTSN